MVSNISTKNVYYPCDNGKWQNELLQDSDWPLSWPCSRSCSLLSASNCIWDLGFAWLLWGPWSSGRQLPCPALTLSSGPLQVLARTFALPWQWQFQGGGGGRAKPASIRPIFQFCCYNYVALASFLTSIHIKYQTLSRCSLNGHSDPLVT